MTAPDDLFQVSNMQRGFLACYRQKNSISPCCCAPASGIAPWFLLMCILKCTAETLGFLKPIWTIHLTLKFNLQISLNLLTTSRH